MYLYTIVTLFLSYYFLPTHSLSIPRLFTQHESNIIPSFSSSGIHQQGSTVSVSQQLEADVPRPEIQVGLSFESTDSNGGNLHTFITLPLHEIVMTDLLPTFPPHPHTARIHTAHIRSTPSEEFRPYEETQYIICYLRPKFSQEEQSMSNRRRFGIGRTERLWIMPGFGDVNFVDPTTPWFLAGREIESIFCE